MHLKPGVYPIQPADFGRVLDVWEASVRETHHFVTEDDIVFFTPLVRDELPHVQHLFGVRDENDQVAGFIGVVDRKIEMLFIHPDYRGQGAGKRLVEFAITTLGADALDVNEQNEQALGFYLRMGFRVVGRSETDGMGKPYPLLHMRLGGGGLGD
jgi:putative acetyltransferase